MNSGRACYQPSRGSLRPGLKAWPSGLVALAVPCFVAAACSRSVPATSQERAKPAASAAPAASSPSAGPADQKAAIPGASAPPASSMAPRSPPPLKLWESVRLADGRTFEVSAEQPQAPLERVGDINLSVVGADPTPTIRGLNEIFGDTSELARRAGHHESTDVSLVDVGRVANHAGVEVALITHSGEDLRDSFIQSSLWLLTAKSEGPVLTKLWSGPGGEFHFNFESCLFGIKALFKLDVAGAITLHCNRTTHRGPEARRYEACSRAPKMECTDRVVAKLGER